MNITDYAFIIFFRFYYFLGLFLFIYSFLRQIFAGMLLECYYYSTHAASSNGTWGSGTGSLDSVNSAGQISRVCALMPVPCL